MITEFRVVQCLFIKEEYYQILICQYCVSFWMHGTVARRVTDHITPAHRSHSSVDALPSVDTLNPTLIVSGMFNTSVTEVSQHHDGTVT